MEAQTYERVEHVVVDAASNDGTVDWLRAQRGVRWISESDRGRYHGMNKGADIASGDLLWFLHAGDTFASNDSVRLIVDDWVQKRWRWAYGAARLRDRRGRLAGVNAPFPFHLQRFALGETVLPHQAACFEKTFFDRLGGYDEEFGIADDQLFMLRAAQRSEPGIVPEFLCEFDLSGVGCRRGPFVHHYDSARARRKVGVRIGDKAGLIDGLLFLSLGAIGVLRRVAASQLGPERE